METKLVTTEQEWNQAVERARRRTLLHCSAIKLGEWDYMGRVGVRRDDGKILYWCKTEIHRLSRGNAMHDACKMADELAEGE